jgi:hypothetical protein
MHQPLELRVEVAQAPRKFIAHAKKEDVPSGRNLEFRQDTDLLRLFRAGGCCLGRPNRPLQSGGLCESHLVDLALQRIGSLCYSVRRCAAVRCNAMASPRARNSSRNSASYDLLCDDYRSV